MTSAAALSRTVHVEHCMGTVFTIDIRDAGVWDDAIQAVVEWLQHVDAVFSTYRPDSEISRIRRRQLGVAGTSLEVRDVLGLCADVQLDTGGYFTAVRNGVIRPDRAGQGLGDRAGKCAAERPRGREPRGQRRR